MVVCDLGNPMKGGTKVSHDITPVDLITFVCGALQQPHLCCLDHDWVFLCCAPPPRSLIGLATSWCAAIGQVLAELRFSVHQLSEEDTTVKFDLQIVR